MKLRYSPTSPYVRKVTVTAIETGLDGKIERVPTMPWDPATDLPRENPVGKVPTLIADGGEALYDSPVICEYLDGLHSGRKLFPPSGGARWTALRRQALADGILDAAVARVVEMRERKEEMRSKWWLDRQKGVCDRGLDALEEEIGSFGPDVTIGHICAGVVCGYMDLRLPSDEWRKGRPRLAKWYEAFAKRPSMVATFPQDPPKK